MITAGEPVQASMATRPSVVLSLQPVMFRGSQQFRGGSIGCHHRRVPSRLMLMLLLISYLEMLRWKSWSENCLAYFISLQGCRRSRSCSLSGGYPFGDDMARNSDDSGICCQTMVAKFHAKGHDHSVLWQILEEMHDASRQLCKQEVVKISRDQNNVAHEFTCFATRSKECECFFACVSRVGCVPLL